MTVDITRRVTDRQTDGRTNRYDKTALCTIVHRAVKISWRMAFPPLKNVLRAPV